MFRLDRNRPPGACLYIILEAGFFFALEGTGNFSMFGLSFSNPGMLHGLWAALLPLVIHLLNRRRTVTVPFSNVVLLQSLQYDRMRRVRLKQMLLLILRTLLVLLLVLAFARPTLRGSEAGGTDGARTAAVLVLDRSLSMQHRTSKGTLFDRARARVREALDLFDARDDVHLFLADARIEAVESGRAGRLKSHLDGLRPTSRGTNLRPGLEAALEQLSGSEMLNRELYLFTDLARNGWAALPDSLPNLQGISVFLIPERPLHVNNLGVRRAGPAGQILTVGSPATLDIELVNYGETPRPEVPVQVYLGGRRIAQQVAHLAAEKAQRLYIRFTPEKGGAIPLRVEIGDDDLGADNRYTSVLNIPQRVRVLLVGEAPEETYYLAQALGAASDVRSTVGVQGAHPGALTPNLLSEADVVLLCNVSRLSHGPLAALKRRVEEGAGLMVCLGDRVDVRHYNDRLLPALFPASLVSITGTPGQTRTYHTLKMPLSEHSLFQEIIQEDRFLSPHFYAYYRVRLGGAGRPVAAFSTGSPALAEGQLGKGRVVLFASSLKMDLSWTDLPLSGFFIPLVHQLSRYLAVGAFGQADYAVGQTVHRDIRGVGAREALLQPPRGEARTIWPEQRGARPVWPVGEVDVPGLWEIYAQERLADRFAVHIPEEEPDLTPAPSARLKRLFAGARVRAVGPEEALAEAVLTQRRGRELWRVVLGLGLALMMAEMLIARSARTERQGSGK